MTLGRRLRGIREARKIPQNKVADDLNISNQVLSNYERDVRDPNTFILKQLAEYYNVSTDYLLGFTDNPTPLNDKEDRKSTRLNSSHVAISYAVFCLKKN